MIEILNTELRIDFDLEDYEYKTSWSPIDLTNTSAAKTAMDITDSARNYTPKYRATWVQDFPRQRVLARAGDIDTLDDASRNVLARPSALELRFRAYLDV